MFEKYSIFIHYLNQLNEFQTETVGKVPPKTQDVLKMSENQFPVFERAIKESHKRKGREKTLILAYSRSVPYLFSLFSVLAIRKDPYSMRPFIKILKRTGERLKRTPKWFSVTNEQSRRSHRRSRKIVHSNI